MVKHVNRVYTLLLKQMSVKPLKEALNRRGGVVFTSNTQIIKSKKMSIFLGSFHQTKQILLELSDT